VTTEEKAPSSNGIRVETPHFVVILSVGEADTNHGKAVVVTSYAVPKKAGAIVVPALVPPPITGVPQ
jgi:hypothetical protein